MIITLSMSHVTLFFYVFHYPELNVLSIKSWIKYFLLFFLYSVIKGSSTMIYKTFFKNLKRNQFEYLNFNGLKYSEIKYIIKVTYLFYKMKEMKRNDIKNKFFLSFQNKFKISMKKQINNIYLIKKFQNLEDSYSLKHMKLRKGIQRIKNKENNSLNNKEYFHLIKKTKDKHLIRKSSKKCLFNIKDFITKKDIKNNQKIFLEFCNNKYSYINYNFLNNNDPIVDSLDQIKEEKEEISYEENGNYTIFNIPNNEKVEKEEDIKEDMNEEKVDKKEYDNDEEIEEINEEIEEINEEIGDDGTIIYVPDEEVDKDNERDVIQIILSLFKDRINEKEEDDDNGKEEEEEKEEKEEKEYDGDEEQSNENNYLGIISHESKSNDQSMEEESNKSLILFSEEEEEEEEERKEKERNDVMEESVNNIIPFSLSDQIVKDDDRITALFQSHQNNNNNYINEDDNSTIILSSGEEEEEEEEEKEEDENEKETFEKEETEEEDFEEKMKRNTFNELEYYYTSPIDYTPSIENIENLQERVNLLNCKLKLSQYILPNLDKKKYFMRLTEIQEAIIYIRSIYRRKNKKIQKLKKETETNALARKSTRTIGRKAKKVEVQSLININKIKAKEEKKSTIDLIINNMKSLKLNKQRNILKNEI
ncbi:hypothetical protein BCR36DRAFT_371194 [Piromyces finnis]|uniref:Uncharacterized protein n=1 Tax=Piromyces finnis TaxID=1754191 RepID=A0A1Y1V774_9FUNG|nr:hypothetical protein BCR36DRAFT_371194 [Piromyces finnis]|eukprot:ORX48705.1 hypothetical protein BCR36DRAFT_371194 [Piromyces finnis]